MPQTKISNHNWVEIQRFTHDVTGTQERMMAMEFPNVGCLIRFVTTFGHSIAEPCVFVPGVRIYENDDGTKEIAS